MSSFHYFKKIDKIIRQSLFISNVDKDIQRSIINTLYLELSAIPMFFVIFMVELIFNQRSSFFEHLPSFIAGGSFTYIIWLIYKVIKTDKIQKNRHKQSVLNHVDTVKNPTLVNELMFTKELHEKEINK